MEALILTKSAMFKHGNYGSCVTAHDLANNRLVRFVSDIDGSPIPYDFSNRFEVFDYISVDVMDECPIQPQMENLLVHIPSFRILRRYQPGVIESVYGMLPPTSAPRFMDKRGDRLYSVEKYNHSLELIRVSGLRIFRKVYDDSKKATGKAEFWYNSNKWDSMSVTDPKFDIRKTERKEWEIGDAYLMVSIPTEPYITEKDGKNLGYFKFVAAIYPVHEPGFQGQIST